MASHPSRWWTLVILALAQFMVVLDVTIVNVALPQIQADLRFSPTDLQWVISAYTLLFGGFLLVGGRAADIAGRRRLFMIGLALFSGASLAAGLAPSAGALVAARAVQGFGGALLSPAALSLLMVTFAHGRERNVALGVWGALAGLGGTLGVVAGGLLVDSAGWEWVFFVNVPIGLALLAVTPRLVGESRLEGRGARELDLPGALLGTGGLLAIVYGVVRAEPLGWGSAEVIGFLVGGFGLLAAFVLAERRAATPLVPLRLFGIRGLRLAAGVLALNGAAFLGMFFLTAIFLQQVRGDTALEAGLSLLPMGVAAVASAVVASQLVARIGTRATQLGGAAFGVAGLLLLTRAGADADYVTELLPAFVLYGIGVIGVAVPTQIAAIADVRHEEAGAASGLVTAGYQVGGALGVAVITTLANARVGDALADGTAPAEALVSGFHHGLVWAAVFTGAMLLLAGISPRIKPSAEQLAEAGAVA